MIVDRLVLFPTRDPVEAGAAMRETLEGGLELWVHRRPASAHPARKLRILHFVGNASRAEWENPDLLELFPEDLEVESWSLNYPGYGGSAGEARLRAIPPAALRAYDFLAERAGQDALLVSGNSLGTSAALYVAARRPVQGLVLRNPPPLQDMILKRYGWWNLWLVAGPVAWLVPEELNSLRNAPRARAPAVILTSEHDITVPPAYQRKVVEAYGGERRWITMPGPHNTNLAERLHPRVREALRWLLRNRAEAVSR